MACPYLVEVTMVYCQASPVRKAIPSDRISTASTCDGDAYRGCPLYKEALARALHVIEELEEESKPEH
ncbi:MAG TPA: hypothetical protein VMK42_16555 [Anaeromyxobacteraceae bacterium]|nr:hypothetical protein [Anaeromyxobacteraceae bacterium]